MKRKLLIIALLATLTGCDPTSVMDANIENNTSEPLTITFVSSFTENKTLGMNPAQTLLFQEGFSTTGSFIEPSLADYDSVYIQNQLGEVIKIFKPETPGKNIYLIEEYWTFTEPDKRVYKYDYKINPEDLE